MKTQTGIGWSQTTIHMIKCKLKFCYNIQSVSKMSEMLLNQYNPIQNSHTDMNGNLVETEAMVKYHTLVDDAVKIRLNELKDQSCASDN